MENSIFENLLKQIGVAFQTRIAAFTNRNAKHIQTKLDALLIEKAKEQGLEISLHRRISWIKIIATTVATTLAGVTLVFVVMFVPGPWNRLFAKPQIVSMSLSNIDFTFNGVAASSKQFTITSPKAIKGVQYVTANLKITPNIPINVTLSDDKKDIVVLPTATLEKGVTYVLTLNPGVVFSDGTYLVNQQSWVIPTKAAFDVVSLSPRDGAVATPNSTFEVAFTTDEFELSEAINHIEVAPLLQGTYKKEGARVIFVPAAPLPLGGVYTVTVSKEMKDSSGAQIRSDVSSTFSIVSQVDEKTQLPAINVRKVIANLPTIMGSLEISATNISSLKVEAFAVNTDQIRPYIDTYMKSMLFNPDSLVQGVVPVWSSVVKGTKVEGTEEFSFAALLDTLPSGAFVIRIAHAEQPQVKQYALVFRSSVGFHMVKRENNTSIDTWAFDYQTLKPEKDVEITTVGCDEKGCTSVISYSPENGYTKVSTDRIISYVLSKKGANMAITYPGMRYERMYYSESTVVGDRSLYAKVQVNKPLYTPGDTLKYSVLLRQKKEGIYKKMKQGELFNVALCPYDEYSYSFSYSREQLSARCISLSEKSISENSQLEGSIALWNRREDLQLLVYQMVNGVAQVITAENISVLEIDKPQVTLSMNASKTRYIGKEKLRVTGRVSNYVGAGLSGKTVSVDFNFTGTSGKNITTETVFAKTDSAGNYTAELDAPVSQAVDYAYSLWVNGQLKDGDNTISVSTYTSWDRGDNVSVTVKNNEKETVNIPVGKTSAVYLNFFTIADKKGIADKKVSLEVTRDYNVQVPGELTYDESTRKTYIPMVSESRTETIMTKEITSDSSGNYKLDMPAAKEGTYFITIKDTSAGAWKISQKELLFYAEPAMVGGYNQVNEWVSNIWFDQNTANVGDKVSLSLESSFKKTTQQLALLIKTSEVKEWRYISQDTKTIEIPITKDMIGGISVCIVHPMNAFLPNIDTEKGTPLGGAINNMCTSLLVEDKSQKLTVSVEPEAATVIPGVESNITVQVKNAIGSGEKSIVGVSVVDKALYATSSSSNQDPSEYYPDLYQDIYRSFSVINDWGVSSIDALELLDYYGGMGGAGDDRSQFRKDFDDNPYWKAQIATDAQGKVTLPVRYSDSITTWAVTVWAVTDDFKVGTETIEVITKKDVFVDIDKPMAIRKGDSWLPYVRITNTTDATFAGTVDISCEGGLDKPVSFQVSLKPHETVDKQVQLTMKKEGNLPLVVKLSQNGKIIDALEYALPVRPIGFLTHFQSVKMTGKTDFSLAIPLENSVEPSLSTFGLAISRFPGLSYGFLRIDPVHATTPELAGALASLSTLAEEDAFGQGSLSKEDAINKAQFYYAELAKRILPNGAFAFDTSGGVDYDSTIQATYAIALMQKGFGAQIPIDGKVVTLLFEYHRGLILSDKATIEVKAHSAYVLSLLQKANAASLVMALSQAVDKTTASTTTLSYLALALAEVGATADAGTLVQILNEKSEAFGNTLYLSGESKEVMTSAQAYLINTLGLGTIDKTRLEKYQKWVLGSCLSCGSLYDEALSSRLLLNSYASDQLGSAKIEDVTVLINNKEVTKQKYNGMYLEVQLPEGEFVKGDNKVEVKSASGKSLFISVIGELYTTSLEKVIGNSYTLQSIIQGADANRSMIVGKTGFVQVTVTANTDTLPTVATIYLPSGLRSKYWLENNPAYYSLVEKDTTYVAYGDAFRSDAATAYLPAMKQGTKITIILPFIANRQGTFSGEIVQIMNGKDSWSGVVSTGKPIQVK